MRHVLRNIRMLRQSFLRLCRGAVATSTTATASHNAAIGSRAPREDLKRKTDDIFSIRRAPKSLYEDSMHSNTLTDHPLTHRTSRDELSYRKRKLTERGNYEQAAKAEEEAERRDSEGRAGAEAREYYSAICFVVLGYLAAHGVVFKKYYPDDLRPYYSPDRGYSDDVAARRQELENVDELIGLNVLESVYSKRKDLMENRTVQNVWIAVKAFLDDSNAEAGVFLRDLLRQAAVTSRITRHSIPPLVLAEAVTKFSEGSLPASHLLLVAVLNRLFCFEAIPDALMRPINDERSSDFADLLMLYVEVLYTRTLPGPVMEQLYLCAALLLLLQSDVNVVEALLRLVGGSGGGVAAAPDMTRAPRNFVKLLSCVMNILTDRRVSIGPVRRSTQRLHLQKSMHLVLFTATDEGCLDEQVSVIAQGVSFLTECNVYEPQEVCPLFWAQLPLSPFWKLALARLREGRATKAIVKAVSAVLRSITVVDDNAISLLLSALEVVLDRQTHAPMLHACRVIASVLESSVETVVVRFSPEHVLYQALVSGAHMLRDTLSKPEVISSSLETGLTICEGISVLAQVLTPLPLPEMDPTDDPDDYAMVAGEIHERNLEKKEALLRLDEFLRGCMLALLPYLLHFSAEDVDSIVVYLNENDNNDFAVWHDELPVALLTTYERLCTLISHGREEEILALVAQGFLALAGWDSQLFYIALVHHSNAIIQQHHHALLIPAFVSRHRDNWERGEKQNVISSLLSLLQVSVMTLRNIALAAAISEALQELNAPIVSNMVECLWHGIHLPIGNDKTPRCVLTSHLTCILEQGGISLPPGSLDNSQLDNDSLAELLSCTLSSTQDVWTVMRLLQSMPPDTTQSRSVADRIAKWVKATTTTSTSGSVEIVDQYAQAVRQWCAMNPFHFSVTWRLVRALDVSIAAGILTDALEMFISYKNMSGDMNWRNDIDCFSPYVLNTITKSPCYGPRLQQILYSIICPSTYVGGDNARLRLSAVVRGGIALLDSPYCNPILNFELFYAASMEYIKLHQGLSTTTPGHSEEEKDNDDDDDDGDKNLLVDLARFSRVTKMVGVQIPVDAPFWLHKIRNAGDEFDVQRVLKSI